MTLKQITLDSKPRREKSSVSPVQPPQPVLDVTWSTSTDLQMFKFPFSSALVELEIFIVSACCQCNCRLICLVRPEPLSHSTQKQKKHYLTHHFASYRCTHHLQMLTKDYWQGAQWTGMDWIKRDLQKAYSDGYLQKRFLFSRISYFVFPFSEVFIHFYQLWFPSFVPQRSDVTTVVQPHSSLKHSGTSFIAISHVFHSAVRGDLIEDTEQIWIV